MNIAFIGLGDIGALIASHLAREPFELTVWNRTTVKAEEFARNHKASVAANPAEAVRDAAAGVNRPPAAAGGGTGVARREGNTQPHGAGAGTPRLTVRGPPTI